MGTNISLLTAFAAGLLSFASPCVLPLLSGYLFFIGGIRSGDDDDGDDETAVTVSKQRLKRQGQRQRRQSIVVSTLFFVIGFGAVFVLLSVIVYGFVVFLGGAGRILNIVSGGLIIVLGLNILFDFIPFLRYDDKSVSCETCTPRRSILSVKEDSFLHPSRRRGGILVPLVAGLAFGAAWTPCVGAFLGSVLLMAGQSGALALSALYLAVYAAGLGVPFIAAAFFWDTLTDRIRRARRILPFARIISGVFLTAMGLLIAFGRFLLLNSFFQMNAYRLSIWVQGGSPAVRVVPALVFLVLSALPFAVRLVRKKRIFAPLSFGVSMVFLFLAAANASGIINCADYLSRWLGYSGI